MLLYKNGRVSSSKQTKHIQSIYFFIIYQVAMGGVEIEHFTNEKCGLVFLTIQNRVKISGF